MYFFGKLARWIKESLKMGKLDGKVAVITRAGSGMGQTTALLFAKGVLRLPSPITLQRQGKKQPE